MRNSEIYRQTRETEIKVRLELDGDGLANINTPIYFFNHMLELFAKHGLFNIEVEATGDVEVDYHHMVEDIGICLGRALNDALGDKTSIKRYNSVFIPMDEALVFASLDISGRPFLVFDIDFPLERIGSFETELVKEFLVGFVNNGKLTLHVKLISGENTHHIIEALFKSFGRALSGAVEKDPRIKGVPSTKGLI
ncbi:MAG TPA: imidazoleglycerol-phosphate dehydratase HisB [Thermoanaerobacterales bacterium]|nr:imidazoleglycerol-phosphate dehydratase HisB [Thermoanaerobacterales bacterium]